MDIMVSVLTTAYNHEPFIAQALDSIVSQKTDFPFELIVHDDASTDGTADIIRAYAEKYPDIIRPILQTENQYSQGISPYDHMAPLVRGKYIALCEGDDYWCDENKLQKQVEYMEAHQECSLCFSNSEDVDVEGHFLGTGSKPVTESRVVSSCEILSAEGDYIGTATMLYRTSDILIASQKNMDRLLCLDIFVCCFLATLGNGYCFAEPMACYRRAVPNSWTARFVTEKNRAKMIEWYATMRDVYTEFYSYVEDNYKPIIEAKRQCWEFKYACEICDWKFLQSPLYCKQYKALSNKNRFFIYTKYHFPHAVKAFRLLKYGRTGLDRV